MVKLTHYRVACTEHTEEITDIQFPQRVHFFPETYARTSTGMVYPPHKLAEKVLDPELIKHLRESKSGKTAFILAAGNGHFAGLQPSPRQSRLTYSYRALPLTLTQVYAGRIAQACGATDHIVTDSSACASSLKVMMDVRGLIDFYGFDRVIVLSVEDAVSNLVLEFFGETKASLPLNTTKAPSAFDAENGGFFVGQGAVFAVFERDGAGIATLDGAYAASETCTNALGQTPTGDGFVNAATEAMKQAGHTPVLVKTHGTGTQSNNISERAALDRLLPGGYIATSYKPTIGHTMGASGLLESMLFIRDLQSGTVPAIKNRTQSDDVFVSRDTQTAERSFLSLAAGMGNIYAAAVWSVL